MVINQMDKFPGFGPCIDKIRSEDALTFEEGYYALAPYAAKYTDELIALMQVEANPHLRGRLVELVGDSKDRRIQPLYQELLCADQEVKSWAYSALKNLGFQESENLAKGYVEKHPEYRW